MVVKAFSLHTEKVIISNYTGSFLHLNTQEYLKGTPGFGRCDTCLRREVRHHNIEEEGGKKLYCSFHYE